MQPTAGQDLPHTHARAVHWLTTAAALGGVVAAVALVQPADASPTASGGGGHQASPAVAPNPHTVAYPMDCAPGVKPAVFADVSGDLDGDGKPETVAVVRCPADTGTPPSGVYILSTAADGTPRIAETLVRPQDDREITGFRLDGRTVRATVLGFSSPDTPRCCPDLKRDYAWEWRGGHYVALPGPLAGSI